MASDHGSMTEGLCQTSVSQRQDFAEEDEPDYESAEDAQSDVDNAGVNAEGSNVPLTREAKAKRSRGKQPAVRLWVDADEASSADPDGLAQCSRLPEVMAGLTFEAKAAIVVAEVEHLRLGSKAAMARYAQITGIEYLSNELDRFYKRVVKAIGEPGGGRAGSRHLINPPTSITGSARNPLVLDMLSGEEKLLIKLREVKQYTWPVIVRMWNEYTYVGKRVESEEFFTHRYRKLCEKIGYPGREQPPGPLALDPPQGYHSTQWPFDLVESLRGEEKHLLELRRRHGNLGKAMVEEWGRRTGEEGNVQTVRTRHQALIRKLLQLWNEREAVGIDNTVESSSDDAAAILLSAVE